MLDFKKTGAKSLIAALITHNQTLNINKLFRLLGLKYALESATLRELRNMLGNYNKNSWYQLMKDANTITLPITQRTFGIIRKHLVSSKPLKINKVLKGKNSRR